MLDDIIVAISTPSGKSGIGVVRLSGKNCLNLATSMFSPFGKNIDFEPNKMVLGNIDLDNKLTDKGFLVYFKSPRSYTGEDVVEFQCHGGLAVTQKIVEKALSLGARLAEPGEFSKRAFLNGKMSLDQAEGVIDTINAETESELKASSELAKGNLAKKVLEMQDKLTDILSEIEVNLDYPEHDIEYKTKENIKQNLDKILANISHLLETQKQGKFIRNGINIAIVGKTNVGKSSLLNALLDQEQAIVTDIEGTTRDVVTGSLEYKGMRFNFLDTAGIRNTEDKIESIGIEKAKQVLSDSDIVLLVIDGSRKLDKQDEDNIKLTANKKTIYVLNKCDLPKQAEITAEHIKISAKEKINTEELKNKIFTLALDGCNSSETLILTNARHVRILEEAKSMLQKSLEVMMQLPLDCVALDVRELWEKLGEITGETANELIIDKIFSKFCLGK